MNPDTLTANIDTTLAPLNPLPATRVSTEIADEIPLLYAQAGCPWCSEVEGFLDEHGIGYHRVDVSRDATARLILERSSGQTKVPTLDWHGKILAAFGVEELVPFLRDQGVRLEDS